MGKRNSVGKDVAHEQDLMDVLFLRLRGMKKEHIAETLGISYRTLDRWLPELNRRGWWWQLEKEGLSGTALDMHNSRDARFR